MDNIKLFENLAQNNYNGQYYDFHNNYLCTKILVKDNVLTLFFTNNDNAIISLQFQDVSIEYLEFFNVKNINHLTIDNIYRGRYEKDGELVDITKSGKYYFYLEFVEGQKVEFFARNIILNEINI
jgi:hypothetical protein